MIVLFSFLKACVARLTAVNCKMPCVRMDSVYVRMVTKEMECNVKKVNVHII